MVTYAKTVGSSVLQGGEDVTIQEHKEVVNNMVESRKVDVLGETCPVPLVETRKAVRKASPGDIIEVEGNHPESKEEIPMAVEELELELLEIEEDGDRWRIKIKIPEDY